MTQLQADFSLTQSLLQKIKDNAIAEKDIADLRLCLQHHDIHYYVNDNPSIADAEYDLLFKTLKNIEEKNPALITPTSPTQRVALGLNGSFATVNHLVPMLSLENSYDQNDLIDWDRKCRELSGTENIEYCVEPKFDGTSISLVYENNELTRAATRGNGLQGDDITNNAKQIRSIPLHTNISELGFAQMEIRGEVVITKERFAQYNQKIIAEGLAPLANPRNAASGALRMKDPTEVAKRNLDAFLYQVSYTIASQANPPVLDSHFGALQALQALGFKTSAKHSKVFTSIQEVIEYVQNFESKRDELPYEIDGMVIKVNHFALQDKIGQTSHHPRWAIAFKFKARQATSKLLAVEYQVGRTGSVTPVAKIEPVFVGGVTISSLSLFNEEVVQEKQLMLGDTVLIERAGDVIPYVVKSFPELRTGNETSIVFPTHCPVCSEALYKPEEEAVWRCVNINCAAQVVERIIHFASKNAMDIRGLGDANIRNFYAQGILKNIVDIYALPFDKIKTQEGFGAKSIENMQAAIEQSKQQPLNKLIFALGIRYVGETTAKTLARNVGALTELYSKTIEELLQLEDVGIKVATSIVEFCKHHDNRAIIEQLQQHGVNTTNTQKQEALVGGLLGKSFLFTGTLTQLKRSDAEALVEKNGGNIVGGVSTKLHYLVVGADAGSKLEKAKKLGTINIISEEEFIEMVKE